jgi:hypothetical protein
MARGRKTKRLLGKVLHTIIDILSFGLGEENKMGTLNEMS